MATNSPESTLSITALFNVLLRRKFYIILPAILLGGGFTWYAFHLPNQYRAQALIAASNLASPYYLKEVAPQPLDIQDHLWTVREVMFSSPVLEKAARQLATYRDAQGPLPTQALDDFKEAIAIKVDGEHTFTVSYDGDKPEEVANVANALAKTFVDLASARTTQRTEDTQTILKQ